MSIFLSKVYSPFIVSVEKFFCWVPAMLLALVSNTYYEKRRTSSQWVSASQLSVGLVQRTGFIEWARLCALHMRYAASRRIQGGQKLAKGHARVIPIALDVNNDAALEAEIAKHDLVIRYHLQPAIGSNSKISCDCASVQFDPIHSSCACHWGRC